MRRTRWAVPVAVALLVQLAGLCAALPPPPRLPDAGAAILVSAADGQVLCELRPDQRMFPASLTKMMTGALAAEAGGLDRLVTISPMVADTPETGLNLEPRERLPLRDLLRGTLIWSANDAAAAVAEAVGGSAAGFVDRMNSRAAAWGAHNTHFANPHGLHSPRHYSTARDLATIAVHAMSLPEFRQIVATHSITLLRPTYDAPKPTKAKALVAPAKVRRLEKRLFTNRNRLLLRWNLCNGIKTGYTREAGRCLAASATRNGWRAIAVVLKAKDPWTDCRRLLEWAFASHGIAEVVTKGQEVGRVAVRDGTADQVTATAERALAVLLPLGAPAPTLNVRAEPVSAPVRCGDKVGTAQVLDRGSVRGEVDLVASADVPLSTWGQIKRLSLPALLSQGVLCLAAGVLLLGTAAKVTRTRRRSLAAKRRADHPRGPGDDQRPGSMRAGYEGRPRQQRDRG